MAHVLHVLEEYKRLCLMEYKILLSIRSILIGQAQVSGNEKAFCLYCYKEMEHILDEKVWRCVNELCALYMKDQFNGETHD